MPARAKAKQAASAARAAKRGEAKPGALKGPARQMYETMTDDQLDEAAVSGRRKTTDHVKAGARPAAKKAARKSAARAVKSTPRTRAKKTAKHVANSSRTQKASNQLKRARPPKKAAPRRAPN